MFNSARPLHILRSLVFLSLIGFAVLVLIGPVVAIAGAVVPFALIGGLAWGGYRVTGRMVRRLRGDRSRLVVKAVDEVPVLYRPVVEERPARRRPSRIGSFAKTCVRIGVEMGCGAALGAVLGVLFDWQSGTGFEHAALGTAIGAVVGFVVGGYQPQSESERAKEQAGITSHAA